MRSIVLSGFMGTGKSTVGPALAARLGLSFVDTDAVLEREAGKSVPDLWRDEGEGAFRAREAALVRRLFDEDARTGRPRVIAFGGGTVTTRDIRHLAIDRAIVVTLTASPETIVSRVRDLAARPNLAVGDPVVRAADLLAQRADAYAECQLALATDALDVDGAVDAIAALAQRDPLLVPLGSRSYTIDICHDVPSRLTDAIARCAPSTLLVVTDAHVQRARHHAIDAALAPLALEGGKVTLPSGEQHKTIASVAMIWDAALGAGVDRDAVIVAIGGGVVGDLAGFAASSLLRGVRFVQVPTTLLAMVDASVGGKTGFDHPAGKNLLGAFHQPSAVVADLAHLSTLPPRERASGLAEIVKIALATDASLFEAMEQGAARVSEGDVAALLPIVRASIAAKIRVVRDDEREAGIRVLLNLGHTLGHAIEAHGGYMRHLHGEAVAIGTVAELRATAALGFTPKDLADRASTLLRRLGLPVEVPQGEMDASWPFVASDKKRQKDAIRLPVVTALGKAHVAKVPLRDLKSAAKTR